MNLCHVIDKYLEELSSVENLQNMLLDISEENIEALQQFITSCFIGNKYRFRQLIYSIIVCLDSRYQNHQYYLSIISFLTKQINFFFSADEIIDEFFGHNSIRLKLLENHIVDFNTIFEYDRSESTFFFFAPEFEKYQPDYYNEHKLLVNKINQEKHSFIRLNGMNESEIAVMIRNDDLESFQEYASKVNLDLNGFVPKSQYEISHMLKDSLRLIEYAAYYAALNIFKFLLIKKVRMTSVLCYCAICGGSYDIIHLLESESMVFDDECLNKAIQFHHNDIAKYLNDEHGIQFSEETVRECIMAYNIEMFLETYHCIKNDINHENEWGWTILHFATMYGRFDIVKILCEVDGININCQNNILLCFFNTGIYYCIFNATPFHWAAGYGHLDILKFYLETFKNQIDVNVTNNNGVTPLHLAAYGGHLNIVKFLVNYPNVDINKTDDIGSTPFNYAGNSRQVISFLGTFPGIDVNHQNFAGI